MKKLVQCLALTAGLSAAARSQNPRSESLWREPGSTDLLIREFFWEQQFAGATQVELAGAERRAAKVREHQFIDKVHQFIVKWSRFADEYNRKGVFNIKSAREMSKAFHDLENTEGWPRIKGK